METIRTKKKFTSIGCLNVKKITEIKKKIIVNIINKYSENLTWLVNVDKMT